MGTPPVLKSGGGLIVFPQRSAKKDDTKINRFIRASEVRVIGADGTQLGVLQIADALRTADEAGLDLVEVSPNAKPPVCKVIDYGKYKYQMSKKAHEAKKKQVVIHVKEIKLRIQTEEHDFLVKLKSMRKFLMNGDKVKVLVFFRGREITHPEFGRNMLAKALEGVKDIGIVEQYPRLEGRNLSMLIGPVHSKEVKSKGEEKDAKNQDQ